MNIGFQLFWNLNASHDLSTRNSNDVRFQFFLKVQFKRLPNPTNCPRPHYLAWQRRCGGAGDHHSANDNKMLRYLTNQTKSLLLSDPINSASFYVAITGIREIHNKTIDDGLRKKIKR